MVIFYLRFGQPIDPILRGYQSKIILYYPTNDGNFLPTFGTTYRPHLRGSGIQKNPLLRGRLVVIFCRRFGQPIGPIFMGKESKTVLALDS